MVADYDTYSGAEFGGIGGGTPPIYRYKLWRSIGQDVRTILFVMLNPSTADATHNDPTIRRCISFAQRVNYGRLVVVNLFAYRASDPRSLRFVAADELVGPENDATIHDEAMYAQRVVCAWGAIPKRYHDRRDAVLKILRELSPLDRNLYCLGKTKSGEPRHPLMLRGDEPMVVYA